MESNMTLEDIASLLAYNCVRNNTILEDIHASGGISQEQMKELNTQVRDNIYTTLVALEEGIPRHPLTTPPSYWEKAKVNPKLSDGYKILRGIKNGTKSR